MKITNVAKIAHQFKLSVVAISKKDDCVVWFKGNGDAFAPFSIDTDPVNLFTGLDFNLLCLMELHGQVSYHNYGSDDYEIISAKDV